MFRNRKYLVSTSLLGGKKQQINIAMSFLKENIPRENGNF